MAKVSSQRGDVVGTMDRLSTGRPETIFHFPEEQDIDPSFKVCRQCCKTQLASNLMRKVDSFPECNSARPCFTLPNIPYLPPFQFAFISSLRGHAVAQLVDALRYKPENRGFDSVLGIFHWHNPSDRTMALWFTRPLTEMSTSNISWT